MDNRHACYVGDLNVGINPALAQRMQDADCLLVLGSRLGDIATGGYTLLDPAQLGAQLLHIHPNPDEPGHIFAPDIAIAADSASMLAQLAALTPPPAPAWSQWRRDARDDYDGWLTPKETPGPVKMEQIIPWLSEHLPQDAILTNGAGNYAAFLHRYFVYKPCHTQLAPTSGSMGYGFPAAISAKLHHPFAALARSYGGFGITVTKTEEFADAFAQAKAANTAAVIELQLDDEVLSTGLTLSQTRAAGEKAG